MFPRTQSLSERHQVVFEEKKRRRRLRWKRRRRNTTDASTVISVCYILLFCCTNSAIVLRQEKNWPRISLSLLWSSLEARQTYPTSSCFRHLRLLHWDFYNPNVSPMFHEIFKNCNCHIESDSAFDEKCVSEERQFFDFVPIFPFQYSIASWVLDRRFKWVTFAWGNWSVKAFIRRSWSLLTSLHNFF